MPELYGLRILTEKELAIIRFLTQGLKNREIAVRVQTTEHVVKNYLRVIYDKLGFSNRVEVALWYIAHEKELEANLNVPAIAKESDLQAKTDVVDT